MVKYTKIYWINKEVVVVNKKMIKSAYKTVLYIFLEKLQAELDSLALK